MWYIDMYVLYYAELYNAESIWRTNIVEYGIDGWPRSFLGK